MRWQRQREEAVVSHILQPPVTCAAASTIEQQQADESGHGAALTAGANRERAEFGIRPNGTKRSHAIFGRVHDFYRCVLLCDGLAGDGHLVQGVGRQRERRADWEQQRHVVELPLVYRPLGGRRAFCRSVDGGTIPFRRR